MCLLALLILITYFFLRCVVDRVCFSIALVMFAYSVCMGSDKGVLIGVVETSCSLVVRVGVCNCSRPEFASEISYCKSVIYIASKM